MTMIVMRMVAITVVDLALMSFMTQIGGLMLIAISIALGINVTFAAMFMMVMLMVIMLMRLVVMWLLGIALIGACALDHGALHTVAMTAAARTTMTRTATVGAVFAFFLGLAMGALVGLDQRLPVGDRDLVVVRMDFAESEEAVPVAAIFDEGGLQGWLYARDLGEIDIAAQLFALGSFEVKLFDAIAADHNDPGLLRVGGVDQHFVGHFGTLDGGGRVGPGASVARPGDATVHLIRG